MSFRFEHKVIWIISPQPWGKLKVSKHHYALTLAEKGNKVFFIEPPTLNVKGIEISAVEENSRLSIVRYRPVFRGQRFLPSFVYNMLLRKQIRLLQNALGGKPEILWCFHHDLFLNLKWFGASLNIFHLVDLYHNKNIPPELFTADMCIAVSPTIAEQIRPCGKPVFFINHGLNENFADYARKQMQQPAQPSVTGKLKIGYIGNLMQEALDRETMKSIISSHPEIRFVFWGPYEAGKDNNLGEFLFDVVFDFIDFLKRSPNVILRGSCPPHQILDEVNEVDLFWICWKIGISRIWDGSNSHKILEYLSTGKPVVSHFVETYKASALLYMATTTNNEDYVKIFNQVVDIIVRGEDPVLAKERRLFAMDNTYHKQIDRIEKHIDQMMHG